VEPSVSYEPVDVYVKDQLGRPVLGVIVKVFSTSGTTVYGQQSTDETGKASFLLSTQQYSMRFYKFQTTFTHPQMFEVLEAPASNVFDVSCEVFVPPVASDSRLCRCSGYFRDIDGSVQEFLDMTFFPEFTSVVLEGAAVNPRKVALRTDEKGYAQIDLIRGACYRVSIESMDNEERYIRVPDLSSANLPDVLYAVVDRVTFDPPGPWELEAGEDLEITPTVYDSAGATLHGTAQSDVDWTMSDTDLANVTVGEFKLTIHAIAAGSVELQAARKDQSIVRIPNVAVSGQPVATTIT
jgi:hypothetical protein